MTKTKQPNQWENVQLLKTHLNEQEKRKEVWVAGDNADDQYVDRDDKKYTTIIHAAFDEIPTGILFGRYNAFSHTERYMYEEFVYVAFEFNKVNYTIEQLRDKEKYMPHGERLKAVFNHNGLTVFKYGSGR